MNRMIGGVADSAAGPRVRPAFAAVASWLVVGCLAVVAVHRLGYALPHALSDLEPWSAINAAYRYDELVRWFSGLSIYHEEFGRLAYPPASYVLLWPVLGWLPYEAGRVVYVGATLAATTFLALLACHLVRQHPLSEKLLLILVLFASYPVQTAVFLGHLMPLQVVAMVAAAAVLLMRAPPNVWRDLAASACLAASMSKPTLAPPLIAAVLIVRWRVRPVLLTGALYSALSLFASAFQPAGVIALHVAWLRSSVNFGVEHSMAQGVPNLHGWLNAVGFGGWAPAASVVALGAFCIWVWQRRGTDVWVLIGAAATVARLWAHHRPYDDIVLFLAAIALLRLARHPDPRLARTATLLLAATCAALLIPAWAIYDLSPELIRLTFATQTALWGGLLIFFILAARASPTSHGTSSTTCPRDPLAMPAPSSLSRPLMR
jgi:hypothetical protein